MKELPSLFIEVQDSNNRLYTSQDFELEHCSLTPDGKAIKVNVEDIKTTLKTSTKTKEGKNSIKIYGNNNIVSINPETGNLIQVNPF